MWRRGGDTVGLGAPVPQTTSRGSRPRQEDCLLVSPLGVVDRDTASPEALAKTTREILQRCQDRVASILQRNRAQIERVADVLVDSESMPGDELRRLVEKSAARPWKWRKLPSYRGKLKARIETTARG